MSDSRSTTKSNNIVSIEKQPIVTHSDNAVIVKQTQIPFKKDKKSTTQITTTTTTTKKIQKLTTRTVSSSSLNSCTASNQQPSTSSSTSPYVAIVVEENQSKATKTSSSRQENNQTTILNGTDVPQVSSHNSLLTAEETSCHQTVRRKHSLMPIISENELRSSSDLGTRDPIAVAGVFGEDFASQFCSPFEMLRSPITPPSLFFDSDKPSSPKNNAHRRLSIEATKFVSPREFPTIKVESESESDDNESYKNCENFFESNAKPLKVSESVQRQLHYFDYSKTDNDSGCARENPEFLRFQKSFVKWVCFC